MNSMKDILSDLRKQGIKLTLNGDNLEVISYASKLNPDQVSFLRTNKTALIQYLKSIDNNTLISIPTIGQADRYAISDAQRRLWILSQAEGGSVTYNMPSYLFLDGSCNRSNLKKAIWNVLERHEILRTVFREESEDDVKQIVLDIADLNFEITYKNYTNESDAEARAMQYVEADAYIPFDLENGPLLRVCLLQLSEDESILYYNMHHIISDGWSMNILSRDILAYYQHYETGQPLVLPTLEIQYKDYAAWQLAQLETPAYKNHEQYWLSKLSGDIPGLNLPSIKQRPIAKTFNGRQLNTCLTKEDTQAVRDYVDAQGGTLFMFLIASLRVLFFRYTGQEDTVITSPVAGRDHADLEDQIGFYINTVALRSQLTGGMSFNSFYEQVKEDLLDAYKHQMYPFDRLVDALDSSNESGRNGLFDVRVVLQNTTTTNDITTLRSEDVGAVRDSGVKKAKFDVLFSFVEEGDHLGLELTYNTDVYDYEMVEKLIMHYHQLIRCIVAESNNRVGHLDYLTGSEKAQAVYKIPENKLVFKETNIVDLFKTQVVQTPNYKALFAQGETLTYQELDEYSDRLAVYLQQKYSIAPNDFIGIMLSPSKWSVVAILGILKSGAAYVPIDPDTPQERIEYLIKDTKIKTLIIDSKDELRTQSLISDTLIIDQVWEVLKAQTTPVTLEPIRAESLAYVIFTSGSTGQPKGVMISHANLLDYVQGLFINTDIQSSKRFALMSNIATDLGNTVIYGALLSGGALYLPPKDMLRNADDIHDYFQTNAIDCIKIVPTHWKALAKENQVLLPNRMIIFGGDSLSVSQVESIKAQNAEVKIVNHYGPTETTIGKLLINIDPHIDYPNIPIGQPFSETSIYVVDKAFQLCPIGVPGELLIGGKGVAKGYLNKPELSNKQFVNNPFSDEKEKLYRTGDLVRMSADGNVEFLGRIDNQVKIRGNRVELGDIENTLTAIEAIKTALVIAKVVDNGDKELVAYYNSEEAISTTNLRASLQDRLPVYMIPSYFVFVEEFPLTANGKINRKALPDPEAVEVEQEEVIAPRNEKEVVLIEVCKAVLKRTSISIQDSFYDLGGDSIKSILIVSRLKQKGYKLKVSDLMKTPVLAELAEKLTAVNQVVDQSTISGEVVLNPIQSHFFSSASYKNKSHYNQSIMLESIQKIDQPVLEKSLQQLVQHHDALRMVYKNKNGKWCQENKGIKHKSYDLQVYDLRDQEDSQISLAQHCDALQASIDLENGPLFKVGLFRLQEKDCILLISHHLVIDGVSWRILLEDLSLIYQSVAQEKKPKLAKKTDAFQRWNQQLQKYATSKNLLEEKAYWDAVLSEEVSPLFQNSTKAEQGEKKRASFVLNKETVELLQTKTHRVYNTEINDILLTALGLSIRKVFATDQVVLNMEGHGREEIIDGLDVSRTVGWFTSLYPFVLSVGNSSKDYDTSLVQVKESLRKLPNKGIGYGILHYLGAGFEQSLTPSIVFNYLGDFGTITNDSENAEEVIFQYSNENKGIESAQENDILGQKMIVSGMQAGGQLEMNVTYNDAVYSEYEISELMCAYQETLEKIIKDLSKETRTYLTPRDLSYKGLSITDLKTLNASNLEDVYRLSPLQEGLYYHWLSDRDQSTYCAQRSLRLKMSGVELNNIRKAYESLIARHAILRTGFTTIDGVLLQVVRNEVAESFTYEDLSEINSAEARELYVLDYKTKDRVCGFELEQDSLMRLSVLDLGGDEFEFVWSNHHILMDGWCSSILINEFYQLLIALEGKQVVNLPEVVPYASYIQWLEKIDRASSKTYWKTYLEDYTEKAVLPFPVNKNPEGTYLAKEQSITLETDQLTKLRKICGQHNLTESNFIQTAWGYLLSKYNNRQDVVLGSVVSGRPAEISGVEDMVGLFINTIPVRLRYDQSMTVLDLLKKQQEDSIAGLDHHYLNLSEIQAGTALGKDLLDHVYVFENYAVNELSDELITANAAEEKLAVISGQSFNLTHYNFDILVAPAQNSIEIKLRYNGRAYQDDIITNITNHLECIITDFLNNPAVPLTEVTYMPSAELERSIKAFNNTVIEYPENVTVLDLFATQVEKRPEQVAVTFESSVLSYEELDQHSNQLANYLIEYHKVVPHDLVGLQLERSPDMLVAIWAVLKTGSAYVPLDTHYPEERVEYIKKDSQYKVCINQDFIKAFQKVKNDWSSAELSHKTQSGDAAYGIYTSGSTGNPKGVLNAHAGLYNRLLWMRDDLGISHEDIILQKTPYTFDVSVWELLMPAITGSQLVFAKPEGHKDPIYLQELIQKAKITIIHFVPSMLGLFLESINPETCKSLRHVVCSGEALPSNMVELFKQKLPWVRIHNLYGPTEAAIDVTSIDLTEIDTAQTGVTIGKPVANTKIYIVDEYLSSQAIGVPGELLIEGIQVAKGYLNRPDLNADKFIASPFNKGERIYRTGDLAKWLPNGEIAYIGRLDHQVKIRGNRIELGEIETQIQASGLIDNAAVLVKKSENEHKYLVAYIIPKETYLEDDLFDNLSTHLPEYMVPSRIIALKEFPLTTSGKINRKALAALEEVSIPSEAQVAPRNETEVQLTMIWEEILGYEGIGVTNNFFRVGGDSILSIRLISKLNQTFKVELTIAQLYESNTIEALANLIEKSTASFEAKQKVKETIKREIKQLKSDVLSAVENPYEIEDVYPMSDIQKGMAILSALNPGAGVYHDQFIYQIPSVNVALFKKAMSKLVWKHPSLRTLFDLATHSKAVQLVQREVDFHIDVHNLQDLAKKEKEAFIQNYMEAERNRPFKIDEELLWRISLFEVNDTASIFLFQFHHVILDGWSVASLNTELFKIYRKLEEQTDFKIDKLQASNRDAIIEELYDKQNVEIADFWKKELEEYKRLDIFNDKNDYQKIIKQYDFDFKYRLEKQCQKDGLSLKSAIYAAFTYALKLVNYENDFVVGVVANNRPAIEDGDKLLGCFLNTIPVRNRLENIQRLPLKDYLRSTDENLIRIKKNERLTLYEISKLMNEHTAGGSPFFDVMFNFVNFHVYDSLELETDSNYKESQEEDLDTDSFVLTNTIFDFTANALGKSLSLKYKLNRGLKNDVSLEQIHRYVDLLLTNYIENAERKIEEVDYLSTSERAQAQQKLEKVVCTNSCKKTIVDWFEEQAVNVPETVAVVAEDVELTYREVNERANQLANYLQAKYCIAPNDLIGLTLTPSVWSVVSILAILKSGAGYVPIDPETPAERAQYLINETKIKTLITQAANKQARQYEVDVLVVDELWPALEDSTRLISMNRPKPQDLAYVIFTSGSTGKPKGVMVTHANLMDYATGLFANTNITKSKRFALMSNIATDLGNTVFYGALLSGGSLYLPAKETILIAEDAHRYFKKHAIDCIKIVPSHWNALAKQDELLLPNKMIVFGGDVLPLRYVEAIQEQNPEIEIINHYGPTETTIGKLLNRVGRGIAYPNIPIGQPFSDTLIYVVDKDLKICPTGIPGELLIGGKGVAKGYLNNPELTYQQFISNPFVENTGKVYRTGDLVRQLPDGKIEFIGRKDGQVKIRGHRIELGEIQTQLQSSNLVENAVVLTKTRESGRRQLVAFVIPNEYYDEDKLYEHLNEYLPDYMVPSQVSIVEEFPLTANGKINRSALMELELDQDPEQSTAPRNETETIILNIWESVLEYRGFGVEDNFFRVGGDSLLVVKLKHQLGKVFDRPINIVDLFNYTTIEAQANLLAEKTEELVAVPEIDELKF